MMNTCCRAVQVLVDGGAALGGMVDVHRNHPLGDRGCVLRKQLLRMLLMGQAVMQR